MPPTSGLQPRRGCRDQIHFLDWLSQAPTPEPCLGFWSHPNGWGGSCFWTEKKEREPRLQPEATSAVSGALTQKLLLRNVEHMGL